MEQSSLSVLWRNALSPYSKGRRRISAVVLAVAGPRMTKISPTRKLVTLIKRVNAFGPRGLSGGALLNLGGFTSPAIYAPDS